MKNLIIVFSVFISFLFSAVHLWPCSVSVSGNQVTFGICYQSNEEIAGLPFTFDGGDSGLALTGAAGGEAGNAGFTLATSSYTGTVLGFSFTGATISPSSGDVLVFLTGTFTDDFAATNVGPIMNEGDSFSTSDAAPIETSTEYAVWTGGDELFSSDSGCTDSLACNYDNTANVDNGSCEYNDCFGQCGGLAEIDDCGQCNLPDYMNFYMDDCGVCFGNNQDMDDCGVCYGENQDIDDCGVCFGNNQDMDCSGNCFGSFVIDDCGICNGNNQDMDDCGICNGNNQDMDDCGVCFGENQAMDDCGVCYGGNQDMDDCGVCYGSNTCLGCTDETAMNYDVTATIDDNTCLYPGCTYQLGFNYDETANFDDGSCIFILGDMNNDFVLDVIDVVLSVESILNAD